MTVKHVPCSIYIAREGSKFSDLLNICEISENKLVGNKMVQCCFKRTKRKFSIIIPCLSERKSRCKNCRGASFFLM